MSGSYPRRFGGSLTVKTDDLGGVYHLRGTERVTQHAEQICRSIERHNQIIMRVEDTCGVGIKIPRLGKLQAMPEETNATTEVWPGTLVVVCALLIKLNVLHKRAGHPSELATFYT
jgi:hypothetical protein